MPLLVWFGAALIFIVGLGVFYFPIPLTTLVVIPLVFQYLPIYLLQKVEGWLNHKVGVAQKDDDAQVVIPQQLLLKVVTNLSKQVHDLRNYSKEIVRLANAASLPPRCDRAWSSRRGTPHTRPRGSENGNPTLHNRP